VSVFVDTSAVYALIDADDGNHVAARQAFENLRDAELTTHAYVVVESLALVARRLGREAVRHLIDDLLPVIDVQPVDAVLHTLALAAYRESNDVRVSFVDRTSFAFMRLNAIEAAFAFDAAFARAGLRSLPSEA
jgi:predicted nucleic acid-binding protein